MENNNFILILTTCPPNEAEEISKELIKKKLAACVNIIPKINSVYFWSNTINSEIESQLLIKTKNACLKKIEAYLLETISYNNPEIIVLPIIYGSSNYLKWINDTIET